MTSCGVIVAPSAASALWSCRCRGWLSTIPTASEFTCCAPALVRQGGGPWSWRRADPPARVRPLRQSWGWSSEIQGACSSTMRRVA